MEDSIKCRGCMNERTDQIICPYCGYDHNAQADSPLYIKPGTIINNYVFGRVLGHGGFGITYIGFDQANNRKVAIKEYLPAELATRHVDSLALTIFTGEKAETFRLGIDKFKREAETIQEFSDFPGIVDGYGVFEANNTAYFVMEYIEGVTLKDYIAQKGGKLPFGMVRAILIPIIDALSEMHRKGILHRDISPDNIYITQDKQVKLLDFGAARQAIGEHNKSLSVVLKHGFTPKEQYFTKGNQGSWTDVYALGATAYYMLTGKVPQPALDRLEQDKLLPISSYIYDINPEIDNIFAKVLALDEQNRFQTVDVFKDAIVSFDPAARPYPSQSQTPYTSTQYQPGNGPTPQVAQPQFVAPVNNEQSVKVVKKGSKGLIAALIAIPVFLVLVIGIVLVAFVLPRTPDVYKMTEEEAISMLEDAGFDYDIEYDTNEKIDAGDVTEQEPEADKLSLKKFVTLVVSRGPKELEVPNVLLQNEEEAIALLEKNGFDCDIESTYSIEPEGQVFNLEPAPGTEVKNGSSISVMVSKGFDPNWAVFEDENLEQAIIDSLELSVDLTKEKISKDLVKNETDLYLYDTNIKSLKGIEAFEKLEYLTCSGGQLSTISELPLTIMNVDFSNNVITGIDLSKYTNLYSANLSGNQLTKVPSLPAALESLYLYDNQIVDLTGVEGLNNLTSIDVSYNQISDFTPLDSIFSNLTTCYTEGNPSAYGSSSPGGGADWSADLSPTFTETSLFVELYPDDNATYLEFSAYTVDSFSGADEIIYYGTSDRYDETFDIYTYEADDVTADFYTDQTYGECKYFDVYGPDLPLFGEYDIWCETDTYSAILNYFGEPYDYAFADGTVSMYYVTSDLVYCFVCNQEDGIISFLRVFDKDYFFEE